MSALSRAALLLLLVLSSNTIEIVEGQTCRVGKNKTPHQQTLWQDDFPIGDQPEALCEGTISVSDDGEICIDGRVTYRQLADYLDKPIRAPAADSISINGHLITGSANVILGRDARFLVDFITKYKVGDTTYAAGKDIINNTLAASYGLITGICLDKSFAQDEEFYSISHKTYTPGTANMNVLSTANIIYASTYSIVGEYWGPSNYSPYFGTILNTIVECTARLVPSFIFNFVPVLGGTGIFRAFVKGTVSTRQFPQAITAPPTVVEDVQIDTEWDTLIAAMEDGLFTKDKVPLYFGAFIKKIEPKEDTFGCWKTATAALDIQAPMGRGDSLDKYVRETVLPYLKSRGTVGLHLGKRLDNGSELLMTAMETYEKNCGVTLNLSPNKCYHPACTRTSSVTGFEYPAEYYKQPQSKRRDRNLRQEDDGDDTSA